VPQQFSWVDQRLVRERYVDRLSHEACALYLFLVTVADAQGLSYYADRSLSQRLSLAAPLLRQARQVAYLQLADIVSSPLPCRLNDTHQPMISTPTVFSIPRPTLLVCI
jgi:hypothetical protein